jgi:hypothetical protein
MTSSYQDSKKYDSAANNSTMFRLTLLFQIQMKGDTEEPIVILLLSSNYEKQLSLQKFYRFLVLMCINLQL